MSRLELSRPALVLVGIPGSGKSVVGSLVADRLGLPLIEVDDLVEAELGAPATEFFASVGEAPYRTVEAEVAVASLQRRGVVVLSSGAVTSPDVRAALAGLPVAWLRATVAIATRRLGLHSLGMAGLVAIRNSMDAMLVERARWYAMVATLELNTDRMTAEQVAAAIITELGAL